MRKISPQAAQNSGFWTAKPTIVKPCLELSWALDAQVRKSKTIPIRWRIERDGCQTRSPKKHWTPWSFRTFRSVTVREKMLLNEKRKNNVRTNLYHLYGNWNVFHLVRERSKPECFMKQHHEIWNFHAIRSKKKIWI